MGLVGSLEDLGLWDLLQIVGLSRKSGVLVLRSEAGEGRIVLRDGTVCGASLKDQPDDLRGLLVSGGHLSEQQFESLLEGARSAGRPLDEALRDGAGLDAERLDALRRAPVERAVLAMFEWQQGEFSLEVGGDVGEPDREMLLAQGLSVQYLAMESTRLRDHGSDGAPPGEEPGSLVFSGERDPGPAAGGLPLGVGDPYEALGLAIAQRAADGEDAQRDGTGEAAAPDGAARSAPPSPSRLIAIDPDLAALEWLKSALAGLFARVHIFQRYEGGLARIRQVLGRGELPVVVISAGVCDEAPDGASDLEELLGRLRALAPRMPVLVMAEGAGPLAPDGDPCDAGDALVRRPASCRLADPRAERECGAAARELREAVRPWALGEAAPAAHARGGPSPARPASEPTMQQLKQTSDRLRDPAARGEVLSLVLEFAACCFSRVALFSVRDGVAVGMAQIGLPRAGGPGDHGLREIELPIEETARLRAVVEGREPQRAACSDADAVLVDALGARRPRELYVAPIESGGRVVALVYGDTLPGDRGVGETAALEVVLHEAGLVLDRALLERALSPPARRR